MKYLFLAISFLTVIPVNLKEPPARGDTGRAAAWFPLIGILVGGITALAWLGLRQLFSPILASVLGAAIWIALSGGLHLDGLADCCDGLLHPSNPERRLEIMKDPRLGTFGGVGLILAVLSKVALLAELEPGRFGWIILAATLGRWILLVLGTQPLARPGGMGADFATGLSPRIFVAGAIPLLIVFAGVGWQSYAVAVAALVVAHLLAAGIVALVKSRLGGVTGDVMGLSVECVELCVLLVACL
jgi:adenosylcobinamide-GDP ribazoletransferase